LKTDVFIDKSLSRRTQMLHVNQCKDLTTLGHSMLAWKHEPRQIFQLSHRMDARAKKKLMGNSPRPQEQRVYLCYFINVEI
jgi:hypothetical protein